MLFLLKEQNVIFAVCFPVCLFCLQLLGHPFPPLWTLAPTGSSQQVYSQSALWVWTWQTWKSMVLSCLDVFNEVIHWKGPDWEAYELSFLCDVLPDCLLKVVRVLNTLRIVQTYRNTQSQR